MDTGLISKRYATALLHYTDETGGGDRVCTQVRHLLARPDKDLPEGLEPELVKLVSLLSKNGHLDDVRFVFRSFLSLYYHTKGILPARLVTTEKAGPEFRSKVQKMLEEQFHCQVHIDYDSDPSLIGGFIITVDDYMLDASVKHQLEIVRRSLVVSNNRIV